MWNFTLPPPTPLKYRLRSGVVPETLPTQVAVETFVVEVMSQFCSELSVVPVLPMMGVPS